MKNKIFYVLIAFCLFLSFTFPYSGNDDITSQDVLNHIKYLASDELAGRFPGTKGDSLSDNYLIKEFKSYGLLPAGDDGYKQHFDFVSSIKLAENNSFSVTLNGNKSEFKVSEDFTPLGLSSIGSVKGEMVFVGYGINSSEKNYNDFSNIDINNKIAVILRYSPGHNDAHDNPFQYIEGTRQKYEAVIEAGASGAIMITGPNSEEEDELMNLRVDNSSIKNKIPFINCKRSVIEKILQSQGKNLKDIQQGIDSLKNPNSFSLNAEASFQTDFYSIKANTSNIIGYVEGSDPVLKKEVIVVGAHMDHLGDGMSYGSLNETHTPEIHNGADDNASGTAGVLEVAQKFASLKKEKPETIKRSFIFMLFSAEEAGLLGSAFFTKSELAKKYNIIAMINMDMIGRLSDNKLFVSGTGTSSIWENLLDSVNKNYSFTMKYEKQGYGSSDYSSFYTANLPILGFFTGLHKDYHRPSDDWQLIDTKGEEKILKLVYDVILTLNSLNQKPDFIKAQDDKQQTTMTGFRVTLGVIPDYSGSGDGMAIVGVKPGGVAEKAGLLAGDIIIKFGDNDIKNIYDYTFALGKFKPGDETDVIIKRGEETLTMKVQFPKK
jgi:aminopeptidase YwaD